MHSHLFIHRNGLRMNFRVSESCYQLNHYELDIVVSSKELPEKVDIGAIVDGTFWFTGKIIE